MPSLSKRFPRSGCPIATTLDLVGDRWTLVIARDMLMGKKRFAQFLTSPERITTNVLTERLSAMQEAGLIEKLAYQQRPIRFEYRLTKKGLGLADARAEAKEVLRRAAKGEDPATEKTRAQGRDVPRTCDAVPGAPWSYAGFWVTRSVRRRGERASRRPRHRLGI